MPNANKAKGARAERAFARALSLWTGVEFHRTPSSGALKWADDFSVRGDVVAPPFFFFPFVVEIKTRKKLPEEKQIISQKSIYVKFWTQVYNDAVSTKKHPLLAFRQNYMSKNHWFLAVSKNLFSILSPALLPPKVVSSHFPHPNPDFAFVVFPSENLFQIPYAELVEKIKTSFQSNPN